MTDWGSALAGGVVVFGGKILWDWLTRKKTNGTSGERDVSFWMEEFQEIKDILRSGFAEIAAKLDSIKESLERVEDMLRIRRR